MRNDRAVALSYDASLPAPFLVAKGSGLAAGRLKQVAELHGVPVVRDAEMTGFLFPLDVGEFVPPGYWEIVARLFILIGEMESK